MNELPLSKFAPFNKEECRFQPEVTNKLKDINVKCSNCIYLGNKKSVSNEMDAYPMSHYPFGEDKELYSCNILHNYDDVVSSNSLCRFFTNIEEVENPEEEQMSEEAIPSEELSNQLQNLDFSNPDISDSINKLREKLINE